MSSSLSLCLSVLLSVGYVACVPLTGLGDLPIGSLGDTLDSRNDKGDIQEVLNDNSNVDLQDTNAGGILESGGPQGLKDILGAGLNARNILQGIDLVDVLKIGDIKKVANLKNLKDSINIEDNLNKVLKSAGKDAIIGKARLLNKSRTIGGSGPQGNPPPACDPVIKPCDVI